MRRIFLVLCVFLFAGSLFAQGVKTLDAAWAKAAKAGDAAALTALYAPDAMLYPPDEMMAKGREAIRASYDKFLAANTVQDVQMMYDASGTAGNSSWASGHFKMTVAPKSGGAAQTFEGRFTSIAARKGGKWMYVVDHASAPMAPPAAAPAN
ncbi:MAG TPA: SgcJ/EcaC family oxidoreductase [Thermoanaerobaculia bacterium]